MITPRMRKALKQLAKGEPVTCGLPTKQRLVKWGFARWTHASDPAEALRQILDRDPGIAITALGLEEVAAPSPQDGGRRG